MSKRKNTVSSHPTGSNKKGKNINSYGYDISNFNVIDIPVRRDPETGRLISITNQSSKKRPPK